MGDGLKDIRATEEPCESLSSVYNTVISIMNPALKVVAKSKDISLCPGLYDCGR